MLTHIFESATSNNVDLILRGDCSCTLDVEAVDLVLFAVTSVGPFDLLFLFEILLDVDNCTFDVHALITHESEDRLVIVGASHVNCQIVVLGEAAYALPLISFQSVLLDGSVLITTNSVEIVVTKRTGNLTESGSHELLGHLSNRLSRLELTTSIEFHMVSLLKECLLLKRPAVVVSIIGLYPELEVDLAETKLLSANLCEVDQQFGLSASGRR